MCIRDRPEQAPGRRDARRGGAGGDRRGSARRVILFRPVGLDELRRIVGARLTAFPPRLPEEPVVHAVLNEEHARQIARDRSTTSASLAGFVTRFAVDDAYAAKFERRVVGASVHEEWWVPAEELAEFNRHIVGTIDVVAAY